MFGALFIPLLTMHLLLVNVAMAGPFVCLWLEWRGTKRDDILAARLAQRLARDVVWSLILAVLLGGLLLGLLWLRHDEAYFSGVKVVPVGRLWAAGGELVFSLALLAISAFAWNWFAKRNGRKWLQRTLAVLAGTNLIYHFPPLFAAISLVASTPKYWGQPLTSAEFRKLLFAPQVLSQSVHIWLASFAVVGVLLMFYALKLRKKTRAANDLGPQPAIVAGWGAWLALVPSVLQLLVGAWVLLTLPQGEQGRLMGGSLPATIIFALGILAALRLMHLLAVIALGERAPKQIVSAIVMLLLTVLLMTATLHLASQREELNLSTRKALIQNVS